MSQPVSPYSLKDASALIERLMPVQKLSAEAYKEQMANLRRYSATHASRNGVPLEIISKVLLRHQDLKTTQVYLGKVTESEAIRWMDFLNGR
jgi:site-specific recombinase XerD